MSRRVRSRGVALPLDLASTDDRASVEIIDQTRLPYRLSHPRLASLDDAAEAISPMRVRGRAADRRDGRLRRLRSRCGEERSDAAHRARRATLLATRPTAVNLGWALDRDARALAALPPERARRARLAPRPIAICDDDVAACEAIGEHGSRLLEELAETRREARP